MTEHKSIKPPLNKDMFISDAVALYPQVVPIFMEYGLHCVGCFISDSETILEGGRGHGMSEAEIDNMILDAKDEIDKENNSKKEDL